MWKSLLIGWSFIGLTSLWACHTVGLINFWWVLFHYSGIRCIWEKINPSPTSVTAHVNYKKPSTFVLWLIGIYVAFFGVASQRYENRINIIENRANPIFAQLSTPAYKKALGRIPIVQNMSCMEKPEISNPFSIFRSLFKNKQYDEMVSQLKETVENWKESLEAGDLSHANLEGAQLDSANLRETTLIGANLKYAYLENADLSCADLENADLSYANLINADLQYSIIVGADLEGAYLTNANLININAPSSLLGEKHKQARRRANKGKYHPEQDYLPGDLVDQLLRVKNLYKAKLDPEIKDQLTKLKPKLFVSPLPSGAPILKIGH